MNTFDKLNGINVNDHTEKKNGLTYLSWAWAWTEVKKTYPSATYEIWRDEYGKPYIADPELGYMVFTTVTIEGETMSMWLPVMDSANHAMKSEPYKVKTKYKEITVESATMFDVNKAIMRCLVKNLAMFGLGLYIYSGEDLPEDVQEEPPKPTKEELINKIVAMCDVKHMSVTELCRQVHVQALEELSEDRLIKAINYVKGL